MGGGRMQVVRKIIDSELLGSIIALPESFQNRKVEVLVLPVQSGQETPESKKSFFGTFAKYADPSLIEQEEGAWVTMTAEKYANR
jgi:hypothetical protein